MFDESCTVLLDFGSTQAVGTGVIVRVIAESPKIIELPVGERREEET